MQATSSISSIWEVFLYVIVALGLIAFAWVSVGTPKLLKRTGMLAVVLPLLHLVSSLLFGHAMFALANLIVDFVICVIPFLCVYINVRRHSK